MSEPVAGEVHEWIMEHQTHLQVAFDGARDRLKVAADRRKTSFDLRVHDAPLEQGQLVYLRECGRQGRHKIQGLWSSVVYRVIEAPRVGGSVYTIAPVDDGGKIKRVHRSLLKVQVQGSPVHIPRVAHVVEPEQSLQDSLDEVDLWVAVPESSQATCVPVPFEGSVVCEGAVAINGPGPPCEVEISQGSSLDLSVLSQPREAEVLPRKSRRPTAGQHSNVHHLPRAVGEAAECIRVPSGAMSSAVLAVFRPWD